LRECARMFLATIILEVNTLEQQDRICYHQNICNNRIDAIGLTTTMMTSRYRLICPFTLTNRLSMIMRHDRLNEHGSMNRPVAPRLLKQILLNNNE
jgi:hypothetical protein